MSKNYQKKTVPVGTDAELVLPEAVSVGVLELGAEEERGVSRDVGQQQVAPTGPRIL